MSCLRPALVALLWSALLLGCAPEAPVVSTKARLERPDLLLVIVDDAAERDYDHIHTPVFDALAARGMRFRRAYASPACSPARRMLLQGRYWTSSSGDPCEGWDPASAMPTETLGLPRLLKDAGYRTALFGKWHLGGWSGMADGRAWELAAQAHGFDVWRAGIGSNVSSKSCPPLGDYRDWTRVDDGASARSSEYQTWAVRDAFLAWHAEPFEGPWFATISFQAPHAPFHAPPGKSGMRGSLPSNRGLYESLLQDLDEALGEILAVVDPERTVVLVLGDNGTPQNAAGPGQDPLKLKKSTYEDGIRVPMIWAGPGIAQGENNALASLVDVFPTLAEIAGRALSDPELDGVSLTPILAGGGEGEREYVFAGLTDRIWNDLAVVTHRWKLRDVEGTPFLFDLERDPLETTNLAGLASYREREAELRALLERHRP